MQELWTAQEAALKWGITSRHVRLLIKSGRVKGSTMTIVNGKCTWMIPQQAKPIKFKTGRKTS